MSTFILPSNPNTYDAQHAFNDLHTIHWVQHNNKSVSVGDTIYIYESKPTQRIILKTEVVGRDIDSYHIDDSKYSTSGIDFSSKGPWLTLRLIKNIDTCISLQDLHELGLKGNIQSLRRLDDDIANALDLLISDFSELTSILVTEGKKTKVYSTRYERSQKNRHDAIRIHGLNCKVCGFNFEKIYGTLGHEFIEIHHKKPLYLNNAEINIDPRNDLVPLCSNCHRMIHRDKYNVLTVEDLKKILLS